MERGAGDAMEAGRGAWVLHAVMFASPWLLEQAVLRLWVGYAPWIGGDTVTAQFALGLSWVTGTPLWLIHVPLPFASQFAALGAALAPQQVDGLMPYQDTTLVLSAALVVICGVWFGWAARRLRLPYAAGFIGGCVGASMPTVMLSTVAFTGYFSPSVWLPAGFIIVLGGLVRDKPADAATASGLMAIGFAAANVFSILTVSVAVVAVLIAGLGAEPLRRLARYGSERPPTVIGSVIIGIAGFSLLIGIMTMIRRPMATMGSMWKYFLVAAILSVLAANVIHRWRAFHPVASGLRRVVVLPLLAGWLVGSNVWFPLWTMNAVIAIKGRGGAVPIANDYFFGVEKLLRMAVDTPWVALLLAALALSAATALMPRSALPALGGAGRRNLALAPVLGAALLLPLVGKLIGTGEVAANVPIDLRHLIPLIGPVAWAFALPAFMGAKPVRIIAVAIVAVGAGASLIRYGAAAAVEADLYSARDAELDRRIDDFLARTTSGKVICFTAEQPGRCSLLWGYLSYRPAKSIERLPPPRLEAGRLRYLVRCRDGACKPKGALAGIAGEPVFFLFPSEQTELATVLAAHLPQAYAYTCRVTSGPLPADGRFPRYSTGHCAAGATD